MYKVAENILKRFQRHLKTDRQSKDYGIFTTSGITYQSCEGGNLFSKICGRSFCSVQLEDTHSASENLDKRPSVKRQKKVNVLSENGVLLSNMVLKVKSKKTRVKSGLILIEGKRLINDACAAGIIPLMIFYSRKMDVENLNIPNEVELYRVPYKELQLWSDLTTSPGVIGICKVPEITRESENCLPVTVICDQIREPGNLGCILRNSAAAGASNIILTSGCTDLWDTKVLRAGAGAHFRVSITKDETWDTISELLPQNTKLVLADTTTGSNKISDATMKESLPLIPYYSISYHTFQHLTVVVGGETEGLSNCAIKLASKLNGDRITIPMSNSIDSLNSASAVSVILFEIKRQMTEHKNNISL